MGYSSSARRLQQTVHVRSRSEYAPAHPPSHREGIRSEASQLSRFRCAGCPRQVHGLSRQMHGLPRQTTTPMLYPTICGGGSLGYSITTLYIFQLVMPTARETGMSPAYPPCRKTTNCYPQCGFPHGGRTQKYASTISGEVDDHTESACPPSSDKTLVQTTCATNWIR